MFRRIHEPTAKRIGTQGSNGNENGSRGNTGQRPDIEEKAKIMYLGKIMQNGGFSDNFKTNYKGR